MRWQGLQHAFCKSKTGPTLIIVDSHIGYGSPHKQDTNEAHGEPLGEEEVRLTKKFYGWPEDAKFLGSRWRAGEFPQRHRQARRRTARRMAKLCSQSTETQYPDLADQFNRMQQRELPEDGTRICPPFPADAKGIATARAQAKF